MEKLKHLDFVKTPKESIAMIKEVSMTQGIRSYSLAFIKHNIEDKTAWWSETDGLVKIGNLPKLLAKAMAHPFGNGEVIVETEM